MSAIEETTAGKCTRGAAGDATRLALPQAPYADAVHAALTTLRTLPDLVDVGVRREQLSGPGELFIRAEWLPGHDDLLPVRVREAGLTVQWSHVTGWSLVSGDDLAIPTALDVLAAPEVVAVTAMHAAVHGLVCVCESLPDPGARWEHAAALDAALARYEDGEPPC
ncbi:hypothetical protein ACIQJX_35155 [Streptomyces griseoviridis]